MVKIIKRWKLAEDFDFLRGTNYLTKVKYMWRKGWTEIPVIMGGTFLGTIGSALILYALYYESCHDMTPKYYKSPRIFRPDDPKVQKIRRTSHFD